MNIWVVIYYIRINIAEDVLRSITRLFTLGVVLLFILLLVALTTSGSTKFTGRALTLIDPSYAKDHMPLIASVAEHAPSIWLNYFMDINYIIVLVPTGFYYCLVHKITHGKLFIGMYGVFAVYFSCVMSRLLLVLAPACCVIAGISMSHLVSKATKAIRMAVIGKEEEPLA